MRVFVCVCVRAGGGGDDISGWARERGRKGALVSVKVEPVTQTSSDCTPRSQQSTQALAEAGGLADGRSCQSLSAPWQLKCFSAAVWKEKSNSHSERLALDFYIKRFPSQLHGRTESKWCVLFYGKLNILRSIRM